MKTEVKKIDGTKRELNIEISGEVVTNKFDDVFKKINQEAKVSGFRPGHIPQDILEKNFSQMANEMVLKDLIPDIYNKAIEKEALDVIDMPQICDVKLDRKNLAFKASVEVAPVINIRDYKGLKIDYKKIEVSLDDIKRSIDTLKESRKIDEVDDNFAKSLGYPNLPALEKSIETQLFLQKETQQRKKIETELVESIVGGLDFKVPQVLVNRQLEDLLRQTKLDLALKGLAREKIEEEDKNLREKLADDAKKQVKIYLVLAEIAKKENIPLDDHLPHRVLELLLKEAKWGQTA